MSATIRHVPALFGLALRPLPLAPLQPLAQALLNAVIRQHPQIFGRLGEHAHKRFGIEPADLPFAIVLEPRPGFPRAALVRRLTVSGLDARIAGPLAALLGLAQGALDGDALFFSRDLTIEGDVAAVVALRNALDDAHVDLVSAAAACLGPLGPVFEGIASRLGRILAPLAGVRTWS